MADQKVTLETKIKITGVQLAKGLKTDGLKINIDQTHFKAQIDKVKKKLASAVASLRVQPQVAITKSSLSSMRKQIREGLKGIEVGVKGKATGGASKMDGRSVARLNTLLNNMGDGVRNVNRALKSLSGRLDRMSTGGGRGGRGPGGGGGGRGPTGGGGGGRGGSGGSGGTMGGFFAPGELPDPNFLVALQQVPALAAQVKALGATFQQDLIQGLLGTGRAAEEARQRLQNLVATQRDLSRATGKGPQSPEAVLGKAAQDDLKRTTQLAKEAKQAIDSLSKGGRKVETTKQFKELEKEAKKLGLTAEQLALKIDKVFGAGKGGSGKGVDFSSFFGKSGSFEQFKGVQSIVDKNAASMSKFGNIIEEVGRKAAVFRIASIAINGMANAVRNAGQFLLEFDAQLRDINKILRLTEAGMNRLGGQITGMAGSTGVAANEIGGIAEELSRAGLQGRGFGSVMELTDRILTGVQGTTLNATEATEFMIQTIGQLEAGMTGLNNELVTTSQGFDILGRAEDITASKASDVVNAFKRSGASLLSTGATFEEIAALISVTQERTRRGAEVIGTAFKTMATRISNPASEASRALRNIGVETVNADGTLKGIFQVVQETSKAFQNLTDAQQASVSATVAGVRQVEIFRNVVNGANRQVSVLAELQIAGGDAARKQAEEQQKLSVILLQSQNLLSGLVESARGSGLDTFFKNILGIMNGFLEVVVSVDKALGGAFTGTALAFGLAKGFGLAVKIFKRLAAGFGQFLVSLQAVPSLMNNIGTSAGAVGKLLAATAAATGANVEQTKRWAAELDKVQLELQQVAAAQSGGALGGVGGAAGGKKGGKVAGALGAIGNKLSFGKLLGASLAFEGVEQAAGSMNSVLLQSVASVGQMAVNGALLGTAFGPVGTAVGAIGGSLIGLTRAFLEAEGAATDLSELTEAGFNRMNDSFDQLEFDAFAASVTRANKGLSELIKKLDTIGTTAFEKAAKDIARGLEGVADPSLVEGGTRGLGTKERQQRINEELGRLIGEAFDLEGAIDFNKLTEVGLDKQNLQDLFTQIIVERFGVPLEEAQKQVITLMKRQETLATQAEAESAKLQVSINGLREDSPFSAMLGMLSDVGADIDIVQDAQAKALQRAQDFRSTGGLARVFAELLAKDFIVPKASELKKQADLALQKGSKAAQFELKNLFASFFDLSDIQSGGGVGDELQDAFAGLGQFSNFTNAFRTASAQFLKDAGELEAATRKASEPLKTMAQLESKLAEEQLERLRATTKLTQTTKVIKLLDAFAAESNKLADTGENFEAFQKDIISTVDFIGRLGSVNPEKGLERLTQAAQKFVQESQQFDSPEVTKSVTKLVNGVSEAFLRGQTAIRNQELSVRRKNVAAVRERLGIIENEARTIVQSNGLEQMRADVITSQLTGLDKLIAEEQNLTTFTELRTNALKEELAALREVAGSGINADAREQVNKKIAEKERELTKFLLEEQKKRAGLEARRVEESIKMAKRESSFASGMIKSRARLAELLGKEKSGIEKFTAAVETTNKVFSEELSGIRRSINEVATSGLPLIERNKKIKELRKEETKTMLEQAIAIAEINQQRKEEVKQLVQEGLSAQDELRDAQKEVMDQTVAVAEAFNNYVDATQGVIAATTEYTVGLRLAEIEGRRLTGSFLGIRDQIEAVDRVFRQAEQTAIAVGAGEKILADLRKKSIEEQIRLSNELLSQQQSAARSFFTSSREDQADLFRSLQSVKGIVDSGLFGDSFDDFKTFGEDAINSIGQQLLSLPQETRQGLLTAIETLSSLGVGVGGFSAGQLQSILDTVSLGASEELNVDPLFEVQARIAELTEEQARLQLDGIVAANEQVQIAKEQLSEQRATKQLAEIQLERLQQNFDKLNSNIASLATGGGATSRAQSISQSISEGSRNQAALNFGATSNSLALANTGQNFEGAQRGNNLQNDGTQKTTNTILKAIEGLLNSKLDEQTAELQAISEGQTSLASATTSGATTPIQAEFNVQIDGNQQVRVTGLTEGVNTAVSNIINAFGPFVTEDEVRQNILAPILDQINKFFLERGLNVLGFQ